MKKLLLTTTFLVAGLITSMAQGLVGLDNNPYLFANSIENAGTEDYLIYSTPGVPVSDGGWTAQLAYAGGINIGSAIPFYGDVFPGVIAAASQVDAGARTLNVPNGTATMLEVLVFNQLGEMVGKSLPFSHTPVTSVPPGGTDLNMVNFRGFVVPEPSTIALGVLGLGALLLFRRRK